MLIGRVDRLVDTDEILCTLRIENVQVQVWFAGVIRFSSTDDSELLQRARKLLSRKVPQFQVGTLTIKGQIPLPLEY